MALNPVAILWRKFIFDVLIYQNIDHNVEVLAVASVRQQAQLHRFRVSFVELAE
ncbi:MAG TPA: hypothetical protein VF791_19305 [Pyrinomonadaceae bacterium]